MRRFLEKTTFPRTPCIQVEPGAEFSMKHGMLETKLASEEQRLHRELFCCLQRRSLRPRAGETRKEGKVGP